MSKNATFWDRRRAGVEAEEAASAAAEQAADELRQQQELAEKSDAEILAELNLPDPDDLIKGDDFSAFMAKAVPEHIRKRALRKLWRSNPVLACLDGLNDYDDDYLAGSYGNAPLKTSYQVGKGLMEHVLEMARQDEALEDDQNAATDSDNLTPLDKDEILAQDSGDDNPQMEQELPQPDVAMQSEPAPQDTAQDTDYDKPRRMVFHFDGNKA